MSTSNCVSGDLFLFSMKTVTCPEQYLTEGFFYAMMKSRDSGNRNYFRRQAACSGRETLSAFMRDYEYKRFGTLPLLAAIDLLAGEAVPLVSEPHKSSDFVLFLKNLMNNTQKGTKSVLYWATILPIPPGKPKNI